MVYCVLANQIQESILNCSSLELTKKSNNGRYISVSVLRPHWDGTVASSSVDDALRENRAELHHDVLVFVADCLGEELLEVLQLEEKGVLVRSTQCNRAKTTYLRAPFPASVP